MCDRQLKLTADHSRHFEDFLYVYPVISRRSGGLSIGINLSQDEKCNYSCRYCQVHRPGSRESVPIDLDVIYRELSKMVELSCGGGIWQHPKFAPTPAVLRRVNDVAFSGNGEPTCLANFDQAVRIAAEVRRETSRDELKIIVISNATQFQRPQFIRALPILDANNGEIWAKLDAGSEDFFQKINRPGPFVTLGGIVENILSVAFERPVVIQSLFCKIAGIPPRPQEVEAYCRRLEFIIERGGRLKLIQVHTVARPPADLTVSALDAQALEAIAQTIRTALGADIPVEVYP